MNFEKFSMIFKPFRFEDSKKVFLITVCADKFFYKLKYRTKNIILNINFKVLLRPQKFQHVSVVLKARVTNFYHCLKRDLQPSFIMSQQSTVKYIFKITKLLLVDITTNLLKNLEEKLASVENKCEITHFIFQK